MPGILGRYYRLTRLITNSSANRFLLPDLATATALIFFHASPWWVVVRRLLGALRALSFSLSLLRRKTPSVSTACDVVSRSSQDLIIMSLMPYL